MTKKTKKRILVVALFGLLFLCGAPSAHAGPIMLRLEDGSSLITLSDNGAGDTNPLVGAITFMGSIGTFFLMSPLG